MPGRHRLPARQGQAKRPKRHVETSEYVAGLARFIIGYGERVGQDPAALTHLRDLEALTRDAVNAGIYLANRSGERPYSINEIAAIMGISKQAVHKRVQLGQAVYANLEAARANGAVVRLADMRQARAAILAAAGIPDRTGSPREVTAGPGPAGSLPEVNQGLTSTEVVKES
jgi:hypothetical protein